MPVGQAFECRLDRELATNIRRQRRGGRQQGSWGPIGRIA